MAILFLVATSSHVTVRDTLHTCLSRIIESTIADELRTRHVIVDDAGDYVAEIVDVSDASGKGRHSQIARDMTHSVQVTEVVGGAAAEVRLYDRAHALVATYRLSGSGDTSAAVGAQRGDVLTSVIVAPLLRRSRSAQAARAIGHDIAVQIAGAIR